MKYTHTNLNARDWKALSNFYETVFGCKPIGPEKHLHGEWFERVTGVPGAHVKGRHLALPGYGEGGPVLEIFTYNIPHGEECARINGYGLAHLAFEVDDVDATFEKLLAEGGSACGEIVENYYESLDKTLRIVYARDPEGNAVEILHWS